MLIKYHFINFAILTRTDHVKVDLLNADKIIMFSNLFKTCVNITLCNMCSNKLAAINCLIIS